MEQALEEAILSLSTTPQEGNPECLAFFDSFFKNPESLEVYCNTLINTTNQQTRRFLIVEFSNFVNNNSEDFINNENGFFKEEYSPCFQQLLEFSLSNIMEILNTEFTNSQSVISVSSMIYFLSDKLNVNIFDFEPIIFVVVFEQYLENNKENIDESMYNPMLQKIAFSLPFLDSIGLTYRRAYISTCIIKEIDLFSSFNQAVCQIYSRINLVFFKALNRTPNEFSLCWKYLGVVVSYCQAQDVLETKITNFIRLKNLEPQFMINFLIPFEDAIQSGELDEECLFDKFQFAILATARYLKDDDQYNDDCFTCVETFISAALKGYDQSTIINKILEYFIQISVEKENQFMISSSIYAFIYAISEAPLLTDEYKEKIVEVMNMLIPASEETSLILAIKCIDLLVSTNNGIVKIMSPFIVYIYENINFEISKDTAVNFCCMLANVNSMYFEGNTENFIQTIKNLSEELNEETASILIGITQFAIVTHKGMNNEEIEFIEQFIMHLFTNGDINAKAQISYMAVNLCEILSNAGLEFIAPIIEQFIESYSAEITGESNLYPNFYMNSFYLIKGLIKLYGSKVAEILMPLIELLITTLPETDIYSEIAPELFNFIAFLHKNISIDFPEVVGPKIEAIIEENNSEYISCIASIVKEYPEVFPLEKVHEIFSYYLDPDYCSIAAEFLIPDFLEEAIAFVIEKCLPDISNSCFYLIEKIAKMSTESLDPLFSPLVAAIAESSNKMKNEAFSSFICAMSNQTVSLEVALQYGELILAEFQDKSCLQFVFEFFAVAGLALDYDLVSNLEELNSAVIQLDEEGATETVFEYAAIYEFVLAKQLIAAGTTELPENFIVLASAIRFSHVYDRFLIQTVLEMSQQEVLYEVTAHLFARFMSKPPSIFNINKIPAEILVPVSKRIEEFQQIPELSAVINQESGQYINLLNERREFYCSQ